jgi:hypothetical protein
MVEVAPGGRERLFRPVRPPRLEARALLLAAGRRISI